MAAAMLGRVARRLGGGTLRQTQEAAVSRLSSRFAHTEVVQNPCTCGKFEKDGVLNGIQKQKEALYDAIAEAQKVYGKGTDTACQRNGELFRLLSFHVERPGDPTWARASRSQFKHEVLAAAGTLALYAWATKLWFKGFFAFIDWKDKK
ncbi:unnamed protein product [Alopecurus aequalis]